MNRLLPQSDCTSAVAYCRSSSSDSRRASCLWEGNMRSCSPSPRLASPTVRRLVVFARQVAADMNAIAPSKTDEEARFRLPVLRHALCRPTRSVAHGGVFIHCQSPGRHFHWRSDGKIPAEHSLVALSWGAKGAGKERFRYAVTWIVTWRSPLF